MASPRLLTPTLLLGLAALCGGINVRPSGGSAEMPRPFDPADDAILIFARAKTGTETLQVSTGPMMQPPCRVAYGGNHGYDGYVAGKLSKHRGLKCHFAACARNFLKGRPKGSRTWVITSNRNPFSRYPSEMFQQFSHWGEQKIEKFKMSDLTSIFRKGVSGYPGVYGEDINWYSREFQQALGLDILKHPFDFDKKFLRVQHVFDNNRTLEVLVLRLEDITEWPAILKPFFPKFQLIENNMASDKSSALSSVYKKFMSGLQYTNGEINYISKSDDLNHFYTREERNAFILKERANSSRRQMSDVLAEDPNLEDQLDLENHIQQC